MARVGAALFDLRERWPDAAAAVPNSIANNQFGQRKFGARAAICAPKLGEAIRPRVDGRG